MEEIGVLFLMSVLNPLYYLYICVFAAEQRTRVLTKYFKGAFFKTSISETALFEAQKQSFLSQSSQLL